MRQYRDSMQECRKSINFVHQNFVKLKDSLADLKAEKRSLIEKYNATREKYDSSCKCNSVGHFKLLGFIAKFFLKKMEGNFHIFNVNFMRCIVLLFSENVPDCTNGRSR